MKVNNAGVIVSDDSGVIEMTCLDHNYKCRSKSIRS